MLATKPNDFVQHRKRPKSTTPPPTVPPLLSFLLFHQDDYRKKQEDAEWMELIWQFSIKTLAFVAHKCSKCACRHRTASVLDDDIAVKCTLQITDYKTQTNKELV